MMQRILIFLVKGYRLLLSPWIGGSCRFEPTCSRYALQALQRHGAFWGSVYAAWRLLRCGPWCAGGHDPVPATHPQWFAYGLSRCAHHGAAHHDTKNST